jgi:hypothetical protein
LNSYDTPVVPLVESVRVQLKKAGSIQAYAVFRMADDFPAGIDVTEGIEEIHGHVASAESGPPERKVLLLGEVRQNPLFNCMGKSIGLEEKGLLLVSARAVLAPDGLPHLHVGVKTVGATFVANASMDRRAVGTKKGTLGPFSFLKEVFQPLHVFRVPAVHVDPHRYPDSSFHGHVNVPDNVFERSPPVWKKSPAIVNGGGAVDCDLKGRKSSILSQEIRVVVQVDRIRYC